MDTPKQYSRDGMREGDPGTIHRDETGKSHPAKAISGTEKLDINESEVGRNQGHKAAEEIIDDNIYQIDSGTKALHEESEHQKSMRETLEKEFDTDDFRRVDERDNEDSSRDWDAEKSRTGRNK